MGADRAGLGRRTLSRGRRWAVRVAERRAEGRWLSWTSDGKLREPRGGKRESELRDGARPGVNSEVASVGESVRSREKKSKFELSRARVDELWVVDCGRAEGVPVWGRAGSFGTG
ncbi:hypothetical protein CRG98_024658 [Punica granatum]|uniref:Uncharacterized protein n=1 Tax=Punica granatum TaxID=22663 RepID=A0A2I0JH87_PUNGR|nr:hypothetical protein CRG98_024658 [Punica granatum]